MYFLPFPLGMIISLHMFFSFSKGIAIMKTPTMYMYTSNIYIYICILSYYFTFFAYQAGRGEIPSLLGFARGAGSMIWPIHIVAGLRRSGVLAIHSQDQFWTGKQFYFGHGNFDIFTFVVVSIWCSSI